MENYNTKQTVVLCVADVVFDCCNKEGGVEKLLSYCSDQNNMNADKE